MWSSGKVANTPPCHGGDRGFDPRLDRHGSVAQSVEQQIEALCVAGSIPAGATMSYLMAKKKKKKTFFN